MTEETKRRFDAPWYSVYKGYETYAANEVRDASGNCVCQTVGYEERNRISHLPELYDALMEAAAEKCCSCAGIGSDILESGCPKKNDETCYVAKWWKIIKFVKEGK